MGRDLGYSGAPFAWDEARRAGFGRNSTLSSARKYGLDRDELRYILDPADVKWRDYPSETFRVFKTKEEARFGEYRTGRLVLEAWDRLTANNLGQNPAEIRRECPHLSVLRDGAWARPMPAGAGRRRRNAGCDPEGDGMGRCRLAKFASPRHSNSSPDCSSLTWTPIRRRNGNASSARRPLRSRVTQRHSPLVLIEHGGARSRLIAATEDWSRTSPRAHGRQARGSMRSIRRAGRTGARAC